jgi:hypothetical protein
VEKKEKEKEKEKALPTHHPVGSLNKVFFFFPN